MKTLLESLDTGLDQWLQEHGEPAYRAKQIRQWVVRGVTDFDAMSDLPIRLRASLQGDFSLRASTVARHLRDDDGTEKLLLRWPDGEEIEGVLLREGDRRTICVSTQVGCAMGCVFCASGLGGIVRNLTTAEILEQALRLTECLEPETRLSHIVVMGMGEPLANLGALLPALEFFTSPEGFGISARRITISTVGLPAGIHELARQSRPYRLAVSLHAPEDALRNQLVPVNQRIGIDSLMEAAEDYFRATGRRLTFEYTLLGGVNDGAEQARELAGLLQGRTAMVNLIPYNAVPGLPFATPDPLGVREFREILDEAGVAVQVRKRKGSRIEAACGQLRRANQETLSPDSGV